MCDNIHSYEINPRPAALGGGWNLRLITNGVEMGGGVYPEDDYGEALTEGESWVKSHEAERAGGDDFSKSISAIPFVNKFPRDKAAIDFAKVILESWLKGEQPADIAMIAASAVDLADALAQRLQATAPPPAVSAGTETAQ